MTELLDFDFAGLSLGNEVTYVCGYYYRIPHWPMLTADFFLVRGRDGKYGLKVGNGEHLPDNERVVYDTVLDGRKYRIVFVRLQERVVTHGEEDMPELWRMFDETEVRCHLFTDIMYNEESNRLLQSFFMSGYAGHLQ